MGRIGKSAIGTFDDGREPLAGGRTDLDAACAQRGGRALP
jgi:hypothetical protein